MRIEIVGSNRFDQSRDLKFSFFQVDNVNDPDIVLRIGRFKPLNHGCQLVEQKYHVKENYLYCKDSDGLSRWEVEINGFEEGRTEINFNGGRIDPMYILLPNLWAQDVVKPMLEYKLAQKSHSFIHGGAVSKDSKVYIFAGRSGATKTSLIMDLVRKGNFDYLADERLILGKGKVLCFPMSLFVFDYTLNHCSTEYLGLTDYIRLFGRVIGTRHRFDIPIRKTARPRALFIIEKKGISSANITELVLDHGIAKLVANNKLDLSIPIPAAVSSHFLSYMIAYSFVFPRSNFADYWDSLTNQLEAILKNIPIYLLTIPIQYDKGVFEAVVSFLD